MIKIRIISVLTCFLFFAFTFQQSTIKLIEVSSEKWNSGQRGGGSGTEYYIKVKILSDQKIVFDSLWLSDKTLATYLTQNTGSASNEPISFTKNATLVVRASDLSKAAAKLTKAPVKYKGIGLLRYFVNDKPNYLILKKINPIQSKSRP